MTKKALITWGGWEGHEPEKVAALCDKILKEAGFEVEVVDHLDCFADQAKLDLLDLIVPVWTMSKIEKDYVVNICEAVAGGVGLAGVHGGMCDAFRENTLWQFITGANWVSHPGGDGIDYEVEMTATDHPLVAGIGNFAVKSEQYYLHVDPANEVLATTRFPSPQAKWYHSVNGEVDMPVAWTRRWGTGRVYYNSLGHHADVIDHGAPLEMIRRGLLWAAEGREAAKAEGITKAMFESEHKNF